MIPIDCITCVYGTRKPRASGDDPDNPVQQAGSAE